MKLSNLLATLYSTNKGYAYTENINGEVKINVIIVENQFAILDDTKLSVTVEYAEDSTFKNNKDIINLNCTKTDSRIIEEACKIFKITKKNDENWYAYSGVLKDPSNENKKHCRILISSNEMQAILDVLDTNVTKNQAPYIKRYNSKNFDITILLFNLQQAIYECVNYFNSIDRGQDKKKINLWKTQVSLLREKRDDIIKNLNIQQEGVRYYLDTIDETNIDMEYDILKNMNWETYMLKNTIDVNKKKDDLTLDVKVLTYKLSKLQHEKTDADDKIVAQNDTIKSLNDTINDITRRLDDANNTIAALKKDIDSKSSSGNSNSNSTKGDDNTYLIFGIVILLIVVLGVIFLIK